MGAQSDFISEQFVPSERYKEQRRAMAEAIAAAGHRDDNVHVSESEPQPRLIDDRGTKRCSVCKMPFQPDAKPSVHVAFAEHVLKAHPPGQTSAGVR